MGRIKPYAAARHVSSGGLIIAATHTHHGPGNYLSAQVYNQFGSSESGFSKELFDFLSEQIAAAARTAMDRVSDAEVTLYEAAVTPDFREQFVLNRSPQVFELNADREEVLTALNGDRSGNPGAACQALRGPLEPADSWDLPDCARLRATDRRMRVLRIVRPGRSQ